MGRKNRYPAETKVIQKNLRNLQFEITLSVRILLKILLLNMI